MTRRVHRRSVVDLRRHAAANGAEHSALTASHWDLSNGCTDPRRVEAKGRKDPEGVSHRNPSIHVDLDVRCRKCTACLKARAWQWTCRAKWELLIAPRSWFGTLTLRPDEQYRALLVASRKLGIRSVDINELTPVQLFNARHNAIQPELTKWLKRIRKESGGPLRYLLVAEPHKSGLPHYHILIHERHQDYPVRHATLSKQWPHGFTNFKLVDGPEAAHYVAKYLSKSAAARVRASVRYGREGELLMQLRNESGTHAL